MGDGLIAFIIAVGLGTWVYNRFMRYTNIPKNSIIGGTVAGIISFVVAFTLLKFIIHF